MPRLTNPGYVGYKQCAECHAARVAECEPTSHFQTCRVPNSERMPASFSSTNAEDRTLSLPDTDVVFESFERDGRYFQKASREGATTGTHSTIDLVYGAKTVSDEVYLSWHADDSMWELPVAWIYKNNCWGAAGFDPQQGGDYARPLTVRCFECHTTWFEHVPGTISTYRREDALLGVTCERCHGPGKDHVQFHRANPQEKKASHILFPGKLERERLIEVCTQCHSNAVNFKGPANSFQPGEKLEDHYRTVYPKFSESDRVANQIVALRQSKCFQKSEMTCITCHDPHLTDKAPHGMTMTDACTQCHQPDACKQRPSLPTAVADKCVECHMRRYAKINVNFAQEDDLYVPPLQRSNHRIQVDSIGNDEVLLRWYRTQQDPDSQKLASDLETRLLEHWREEGEQREREGRFVAAVSAMRESLRIKPDHEEALQRVKKYGKQQQEFDALRRSANVMRNQNVDKSIELFQEVLKIRPDDAAAHGRIGTLYAQKRDREQAIKFLERVAELDPDDQYGLSMMGWLAFLDSDFERAASFYERADKIEPFSTKINQLWGASLARLGRLDLAEKRLAVSLQADPRNLDAMRELVQVKLRLQKNDEAIEVAEQATRLTAHQSLQELMTLAHCHLEKKNTQIATEVVQLALQVTRNPDDAARIKAWCEEKGLTTSLQAQP